MTDYNLMLRETRQCLEDIFYGQSGETKALFKAWVHSMANFHSNSLRNQPNPRLL